MLYLRFAAINPMPGPGLGVRLRNIHTLIEKRNSKVTHIHTKRSLYKWNALTKLANILRLVSQDFTSQSAENFVKVWWHFELLGILVLALFFLHFSIRLRNDLCQ